MGKITTSTVTNYESSEFGNFETGKQVITTIEKCDDCSNLKDRIKELETELEKEKTCVDFYAKKENWSFIDGSFRDYHCLMNKPIDNEYHKDNAGFRCGYIARQRQREREG